MNGHKSSILSGWLTRGSQISNPEREITNYPLGPAYKISTLVTHPTKFNTLASLDDTCYQSLLFITDFAVVNIDENFTEIVKEGHCILEFRNIMNEFLKWFMSLRPARIGCVHCYIVIQTCHPEVGGDLPTHTQIAAHVNPLRFEFLALKDEIV